MPSGRFEVVSPFVPTGDQPVAIEQLAHARTPIQTLGAKTRMQPIIGTMESARPRPQG